MARPPCQGLGQFDNFRYDLTFDKVFSLLYDSSDYASVPPAVYVDLRSGVKPDVRDNSHTKWVDDTLYNGSRN